MNIASLYSCVICLAALLSCGERTTSSDEGNTKNQEVISGKWAGSGNHPVGNNLATCGIAMDLNPDGTCQMEIDYHMKESAITTTQNHAVKLAGTWKVEGNKITLSLKLTSWEKSRSFSDTPKEVPFDDFKTDYTFKFDGEFISPDNAGKDMNIGTTPGARDMLTMDYKGEGYILANVSLHRVGEK